jgi:starch synthase
VKVLFIASEVAPYSKTGGLADVAGALPRALLARGLEVLVVSPLWKEVPREGLTAAASFKLQFPFGIYSVRILRDGPFAFIEQPQLFERAGLYGEPDDAQRFTFFGAAALSAAQAIGFEPDVVHLNDWQTGLGALALSRGYSTTRLKRARSVFTIHNLAYQGVFPKSLMGTLGLPWELFTPDGIEFHDQISFLKAGLQYADVLTTVSPTYAKEIQTPANGQGLHGLLAHRANALHGILNGIDTEEWNPANDRLLPAHYSSTRLEGKETCARALLERMKLPLPKRGKKRPPIFGTVGRLADQKGVDLLIGALPFLLAKGAQAVIVGTGEERFASQLTALAQKNSAQLSVHIGFDEGLAHLVEAGCDFFMMPSKYEPCGLNQMYSLRYGTVPIVRAVGGLQDTVVDLELPNATGIKFHEYDEHALAAAMMRAFELYEKPKALSEVRQRGMAQDFSWAKAAAQYDALYVSLKAGMSGN